MNVPVIAIKCGIDNEFFLGGELHKFAEAVIEEYKESLVWQCKGWLIVILAALADIVLIINVLHHW